jgi:hypothetical protein
VINVDWPAGHDGAAHDVFASYRRHAPLPSQKPSVRQLAAPWSAQRDRTSTTPFAMLLHTPRDAVSAHDLQIPVHSVSQQTLCSQLPDRHSFLFAHSAPFGFSPHRPLVQTAGDRQSASAVQDGLQAPVPQR